MLIYKLTSWIHINKFKKINQIILKQFYLVLLHSLFSYIVAVYMMQWPKQTYKDLEIYKQQSEHR